MRRAQSASMFYFLLSPVNPSVTCLNYLFIMFILLTAMIISDGWIKPIGPHGGVLCKIFLNGYWKRNSIRLLRSSSRFLIVWCWNFSVEAWKDFPRVTLFCSCRRITGTPFNELKVNGSIECRPKRRIYGNKLSHAK